MLTGNAHVDTQKLHNQFGSVVRISPNDLSFNTAWVWKGNPRGTVSPSRAERHHADIYGSRVGKERLEKDPPIIPAWPCS